MGGGEGAVDLIIGLMSYYVLLPSSASLVTTGTGSSKYAMRTKQQATATLRAMVALTGEWAADYPLHPLRNGGATCSSAGGATPEVLQREGRWASDAFKVYVRRHGENAGSLGCKRGGARVHG